MLVAGVFGPDSLGPEHGHFLAQRLTLLGLAVMVPAIDVPFVTKWGRMGAACLIVSLGFQSVIVWDYALYCKQTTAQIVEAVDLVGRGQRIAPLLTAIRSRFRPNPLLHADSWLGVGTGNILWSNYEARHYYFPVQFRPGLDRPDPGDFELLTDTSDPSPGEDSPGCGSRSCPITCVQLTASWPGRAIPRSIRSRVVGMSSRPRRAMFGSSYRVIRPRKQKLPRTPERQTAEPGTREKDNRWSGSPFEKTSRRHATRAGGYLDFCFFISKR